MSTSIGYIFGAKEIPDPASKTVDYETAVLHLTRFYGGVGRGTCLQITLGNEHIQLSVSSVTSLRMLLRDWEDLPEVEDIPEDPDTNGCSDKMQF